MRKRHWKRERWFNKETSNVSAFHKYKDSSLLPMSLKSEITDIFFSWVKNHSRYISHRKCRWKHLAWASKNLRRWNTKKPLELWENSLEMRKIKNQTQILIPVIILFIYWLKFLLFTFPLIPVIKFLHICWIWSQMLGLITLLITLSLVLGKSYHVPDIC